MTRLRLPFLPHQGDALVEPTPIDGRAAYLDGRSYTSPEMRPGNGENLSMRPGYATGGLGHAMATPAAGGAIATAELFRLGDGPSPAAVRTTLDVAQRRTNTPRFGFRWGAARPEPLIEPVQPPRTSGAVT